MNAPMYTLSEDESRIDLFYPEYDFSVLIVPKCGSSSLMAALGPNQATRDEAIQASTRLSVIRHPVARTVSAWHEGWHQFRFEEWWSYVRDNPSFDMHTRPAVELIDGKATDIQCLEDITVWWLKYHRMMPNLWPVKREHHRRTPLYRWNDMVEGGFHRCVDDILQVYSDDLQLWKLNYGA